jgi:regulator of protease activity HflC (stomatin/prohibitin superfamily)
VIAAAIGTVPIGTMASDSVATTWQRPVLAVALIAIAVAVAAVRVAAPQERLVVVRHGRCRVEGPGLVLLVPGLDRPHRVSMAPQCSNTVVGRALTADGVSVSLVLSVYFHVFDARRAVGVVEQAWVERALDAAVRAELTEVGLAELAAPSRDLIEQITMGANCRLAPIGTSVDGVTVDQVELSVGMDLLRWAGYPVQSARSVSCSG